MHISTPIKPDSSASMELSPVSWDTYRHLRHDLGDAVHLTYNEGSLTIMNPPLPIHEESASLLHDFIRILSEVLEIEIRALRSTTLRREDLQKGVEADNCYYIHHAATARPDRRQLDLNRLPPPDLVVEVDITHSSLDKLPVYLALGVPEVWRYDEKQLLIYTLQGTTPNDYVTGDSSPAFQHLPVAKIIPKLLKKSIRYGETAVLREFRAWVQNHRSTE